MKTDQGSALHTAVKLKEIKIIKSLIKNNASFLIKDGHGNIPMDYADE